MRRFNSLAVALTGEAATDGSIAFGFNLNFSLDPGHGFTLSRRPLAQAGAVHALVYRDLNDNGVHDANEPLEKGADHDRHRAGGAADRCSRLLTVGGLTAYMPIAIGLDQTSLPDPMLIPKKALQVVVPRPGVPAEVQIALVGGGDSKARSSRTAGSALRGST